jgi:hypothetical protein
MQSHRNPYIPVCLFKPATELALRWLFVDGELNAKLVQEPLDCFVLETASPKAAQWRLQVVLTMSPIIVDMWSWIEICC